MSVRHWLAYRDRWKDSPKVITPRDDDDVAEWRRLGYRVEGPFVPAEQLRGAVDDLRAALNELGVPGPGYPAPVANAVEHINAALARLGGQ